MDFVEACICTSDGVNKCKVRAELGKNTISIHCHSPLIDQWRTSDPITCDNGAMNADIKNKIIDSVVTFSNADRLDVLGCMYSFFDDISKQPWYIGLDMLDNRWAGMRVPTGYTIKSGKVSYEKMLSNGDKMEVPFCRVPAITSSIGMNIDNNEYWVEVLFTDIFGAVHREWISQQDALSRRGVMKLTDRGINLIEKNSSYMNEYLSTCLEANRSIIPNKTVTEKMGWKCNNTMFAFGERGFLKDKVIDIIPLRKKVSDGLQCVGDIEQWINAAKPIIHFPLLRFKMYAVLTAPLLRLLSVQSFVLDHNGETSIGKTFSNDFAMSLIGDADRLRFNGDTTKTAAEILAESYTDLPLYMDETGTQQTEDALKAIIYMLSNEQGRMRGQKDGGLRETGTWKTIAFTTGERPLTSNKSFSGQQVRVIEVRGGFTNDVIADVKTAAEVRKRSYGHIAKPYFDKVFEYKSELVSMYKKARQRYITVDNVKTNRIADSFAAIHVAGILLEEVFKDIGIEPIQPYKVVDEFFIKSAGDDQIVNYSTRALSYIFDWVESRPTSFVNQVHPSEMHSNEHLGWISMEHTDIIPARLRDTLERGGFDQTRVINDWIDDGIMEVQAGRKDKPVNHGKTVRACRFVMARVDEVLGRC